MKLNKSSWHYKVYAFNSQMVARLGDNGSDFYKYPHHGRIIGLCPYMRMIMLWGPFAFLCNLVPLIAVVWFFLVLPAFTVGLWSLLIFAAYVCAAGGLAIALYYGITYVANSVSTHHDDAHQAEREAAKVVRDAHKATQPDTFWSLFVGYVKSLKTKVCPVLELDDE
jgi:hypothetical protein